MDCWFEPFFNRSKVREGASREYVGFCWLKGVVAEVGDGAFGQGWEWLPCYSCRVLVVVIEPDIGQPAC